MTRTAQQVMADQNVARKGIVLRAECCPSLKCGFTERFQSAGFASEADAIRTLARDFVTGRIQYIGGMLRSQENSEPAHRDSIAGPTPAPVSSDEKNQGKDSH